MSSIHEVFDRLEKWKASGTLLQVTVRGAGQDLRVLSCTICASNRDTGQVGIVFDSKKLAQFDIADAQFRIGKHAIEAMALKQSVTDTSRVSRIDVAVWCFEPINSV
jgi:hypothetical protein